MNKRTFFLAAVLLPLLAAAPSARAEDDSVESLRFATTTVAAMNPFLVVDVVQLSYQHRLYAASSPLLRRNSVEVSTSLVLGPFFAPTVRVALHPLALLEVGASYSANVLFIDALQERRSPSNSYAVDVVGVESGDPATLQSFTVDATVQGALGKVVLRSTNAATYTTASLRAGETVYYSAAADMLLAANSWVFSDNTTLAYTITPRLRLGVTGTLFATGYPASAYAPGESHAAVSNTPVLRVGPSFSMTLRDQPDGPFARADLFASVQWYALDRYRTGEAISGAVPFVSVGVRFGGPLWKR